MNKSLTVVFFLLLSAFQSKAQKEVLFRIKMLPSHSYSSAMKMNMNMEMNMTGDSAFMNKIKVSGQKFPVMMLMQNGINTEVKTSAVNANNEIPFIIKVQSAPSKMTINGTETSIPVPATNQIYYGVYFNESKARIDSISGNTLDQKGKEAIIKMMDGLRNNIKFPEKPMKIGDTFYQDIPMELPIAGMTAKAISKTTYTLLSIINGKGNFAMNYAIVMDVKDQQLSMNMEGGGDGKFAFDLETNYPVTMLNNMDFTFSMIMPQDKNVTMTGKVKMVMSNQTGIKAAQ